MLEAITRLKSLHVADVMTTDVVQVSANQTMTEAAEALAGGGVSAAVAVDEQGRCVGMLSATDFLRRECREVESGETHVSEETHELVQTNGGPLHITALPENMVNSNMTAAVQSVAPETSLLKAAMIMNAEHVHRLPVLDGDGRVLGIISTMDILSSLLGAIDEESTQFIQQMRSGDF